MKRNLIIRLIFIVLITVLSVSIALPNNKNIKIFGAEKKIDIVKGLDINGGSQLIYAMELEKIEKNQQAQASESALNIIRKRVDSLGVSEPSIQTATIEGKKTIIIELPGINDVNQATEVVGKTAYLEFQEQTIDGSGGDGVNSAWKKTGLTGKNLKRSSVEVTGGGQGSKSLKVEPTVTLEFDGEGSKLFEEITSRNVGKPVAIVIDNQVVSAPKVETTITGGNAIITGMGDLKEAKNLSISLNSGALPVPLKLISQRTIGAQLGDESISKSIYASIIGIFLIIIFMIIQYRFAGIIASVSLMIYTIIIIAIYKLIPVTLSLAGIAGFILSIGAAVDANILIFERTKEELRLGKGVKTAIEEGFKRAWPSIKDSNVSSIITAIILIWFGTGIIKGFAVTLLIGILVSMFTAITISQTLRLLLIKGKNVNS
ncbi:MAG: preprotein translocase subunit SecD [Candidatus Berkelbacteria bacterium Licking1014_85]|uniref:Protein translocase subunit SecD n=1 Tax=Candidatus Berkelbacteria bacterium Licking1014_85 TaxID=2017148 RepID=A0A554LM77_9BACT|nr:MAG: preprotein translocase subunit SecD [Candidatus Berkelbacteria bacterium Licking1014_85]